MKKVLQLLICILLIQGIALSQQVYDDNYQENPNYVQGLKYLESSQYASAINEFKKAIRVNPSDASALVGLSNAYNYRAQYFNNTAKSIPDAISDIKSALFFSKYFTPQGVNAISAQSIAAMEKNLNILETNSKADTSANGRLASAKKSRTKGEFAASAYDYYQLLNNNDNKTIANCGLGDIYKIFNRPDMSLKFYQNALNQDSKNTDIHLKLARTYEEVNDFSSALKEYSFALNTSSEREDILNSLEKIWQKKVDENPKDAEAHANLGVVYQKERRFNEALAEYQKAEALNPNNINTKVNIGTLYQEQKKYDAAINTYDSILKMQPQNVNVMVYKAECLKALKRNEDAINIYKTALNLDPKNSAVKAQLFELLKDTMPVEEVLAFLYKNVQNSPMDAESYYEFAYELHKAGKLDDAIVYYNQTIKLDKTKTDAYINLSQAYRQKKNYAEAYNTIKQAIQISPNNEEVKKQYDIVAKDYTANSYNVASDAYQSGDYKKAISEYMKINPQTTESLIGIAASYQSLNDNNNAIEYYKKAMELDSKNADIPYYIASLYANTDDITNADKYVKIALTKNPSNSQAKELSDYINAKLSEGTLTEAVQLYEAQKYKEAVDAFDKVIKVIPNDANIYYYRALCHDALKNYQKAIADYNSVLKYAPTMTIAYYSIGVDYDALEKYTEAKANYQKYVNATQEDNDFKAYAQSRIKEIQ
ncbi:tetratricopeptide repeat protein [bacterium]|nr:tetratricopeptide repeat protein [bacterium]